MSHILACTDGSLYAPSVYEHSAWAAARLDAGVRVLHVIDPHREHAQTADLSGAIGFDASAELTEELTRLEESRARVARLRGTAILDDARARLAAAGIADIETLQRHGSLIDTLEELEPAAALVVIGKRGEHADFAKGHLGGQVQRVIRTSVRPVLVAPRAFQPVRRFLIAFDGGESISRGIEFILAHPLLRELPGHLLRAGKIDDNARWFLEEAAERLRAAGYEITTQAISESPDTAIPAALREQDADLLVMGAYGHSPIRQFILGSTTTAMVRTSSVPVLMFRPTRPDCVTS
jgi:nucleotide-binding universal stress UspA family protein